MVIIYVIHYSQIDDFLFFKQKVVSAKSSFDLALEIVFGLHKEGESNFYD